MILGKASQTAVGRRLRIAGFAVSLCCLFAATALALGWQEQALLASVLLAAGTACTWKRDLDPITSRAATLLISAFLACRYLFWRSVRVSSLVHRAGRHSWLFPTLLILLAEAVILVSLHLGALHSILPLRRKLRMLQAEPQDWPDVDVLILIDSEPLSELQTTLYAARHLDWPRDKLHLNVLSTVDRLEVQQLCDCNGVRYSLGRALFRPCTDGSTCGNTDPAEQRAPFLATWYAGQSVVRSFLQLTVGQFEGRLRVAFVQTPVLPWAQWAELCTRTSSPGQRDVWRAQRQEWRADDFWGAARFQGAGAVLRQAALSETNQDLNEILSHPPTVGCRLQAAGWDSVFLDVPQCSETVSFAAQAKERIQGRLGARLRVPIRSVFAGKGVPFMQRLWALDREVRRWMVLVWTALVCVPLVYMLLGRMLIPGAAPEILSYALPCWIASLAFLPKRPTQDLGCVTKQNRFERWKRKFGSLLASMVLAEIAALLLASLQLTAQRTRSAPAFLTKLFTKGPHAEASRIEWSFLLVCLCWSAWSLWHLSGRRRASDEMAAEDRRQTPRLPVEARAVVWLSADAQLEAQTLDASEGGLLLQLATDTPRFLSASVRVQLPIAREVIALPATVMAVHGRLLRVRFDVLSDSEKEALVTFLYSRANAWVPGPTAQAGPEGNWRVPKPTQEFSDPVRFAIAACAFIVAASAVLGTLRYRRDATGSPTALPSMGSVGDTSPGMRAPKRQVRSIALEQLALGVNRSSSDTLDLHLDLPANQVAIQAVLHIRVPDVVLRDQSVTVFLNQVVVTVLQGRQESPGGDGTVYPSSELDVPLPPELLVQRNELVFRFRANSDKSLHNHVSNAPDALLKSSSSVEVTSLMVNAKEEGAPHAQVLQTRRRNASRAPGKGYDLTQVWIMAVSVLLLGLSIFLLRLELLFRVKGRFDTPEKAELD